MINMLQGPLNNSYNQRQISIAIAILIGLILIFASPEDLAFSLWGPITISRLFGFLVAYIGVALYRKWY